MIENPFVRELLRSAAIGFGAAAVFVVAILAIDLAQLRQLASASDVGALAIGLLFFFCGLTFTGAEMTFRIFPLWRSDDGKD